jgi:hypothetical protein
MTAASWTATDNVDRCPAAELTVDQFRQMYELPGKPVVITGVRCQPRCHPNLTSHVVKLPSNCELNKA